MHEVTLFYRSACAYCRKVLDFMEQNNISFPVKNISENSEFQQELLTIGGKTQVPCLVIDGRPLYESNDIVRWLRDNWSGKDISRN